MVGIRPHQVCSECQTKVETDSEGIKVSEVISECETKFRRSSSRRINPAKMSKRQLSAVPSKNKQRADNYFYYKNYLVITNNSNSQVPLTSHLVSTRHISWLQSLETASLNTVQKVGMMTYTRGPHSWEVEIQGVWIQDQFELHRYFHTLSHKIVNKILVFFFSALKWLVGCLCLWPTPTGSGYYNEYLQKEKNKTKQKTVKSWARHGGACF